MALTYTVANGWDDVAGLAKGVPTDTTRRIRAADRVSSVMWMYRPWYRTLTTIASGLIPLVDGTQDYSPPANIYRLTKCSIVRTDTTPDLIYELDVAQDLSADLTPRSITAIRVASLQAAVGRIRLESAVSIPTGLTAEIQGEYQPNPTKITTINDQLWFDDQLYNVFCEGLLYWAYKFGDDARAGTVGFSESGNPVYTGQLATFMGSLQMAARAEDFPAQETVFPSESIAPQRDPGSGLNIFNW